MNMRDFAILDRCHEEAIAEMSAASAEIAEALVNGMVPSREMVERYRVARLGVEATRKDVAECMEREIDEITNQ